MIEIFTSINKNYDKQARRILRKTNRSWNVLKLENTLRKDNTASDYWVWKNVYPSTIYFLCNHPYIQTLLLFAKKSTIINGKYYKLGINKKDMFKKLSELNLKTKTPPFVEDYQNYFAEFLPMYVKANNHEGITFKATSLAMIEGFKMGVNINDYYFEPDISSVSSKEIKIFYVDEQFIPADEDIDEFKLAKSYNPELLLDLSRFIKEFKLDVCSFDLIFDKERQFVVDINPSPAFYSSKKATNIFSKYLVKRETNA